MLTSLTFNEFSRKLRGNIYAFSKNLNEKESTKSTHMIFQVCEEFFNLPLPVVNTFFRKPEKQ
jgi:hypothetical protein